MQETRNIIVILFSVDLDGVRMGLHSAHVLDSQRQHRKWGHAHTSGSQDCGAQANLGLHPDVEGCFTSSSSAHLMLLLQWTTRIKASSDLIVCHQYVETHDRRNLWMLTLPNFSSLLEQCGTGHEPKCWYLASPALFYQTSTDVTFSFTYCRRTSKTHKINSVR